MGGLSLGALHRLLTQPARHHVLAPGAAPDRGRVGGNPFIALEIGRALARRGLTGAAGRSRCRDGERPGGERLGELPPRWCAVQLVAVMPDAPVARYLAAGVNGRRPGRGGAGRGAGTRGRPAAVFPSSAGLGRQLAPRRRPGSGNCT